MKRLKRLLSVVLLLAAVMAMSMSTHAAVKINKKKATLIKGQTVVLKITGTKSKVKWSSNKKKVATVNKKGVVKAKAKGTAVINAIVGKKSLKCTVKVETPKLSKTKATLNVGESLKLKLKGTSQKIKWTTGSKETATVNNGLVTGKREGTVKITASVGKKKYGCVVTIKKKTEDSVKKPITDVSLNKTSLTITVGGQETLTASYLPKDTTDSTKVSWKSSDEGVVSVIDGIIVAKKVGKAKITATISSKSATCEVTVTKPSYDVGSIVTFGHYDQDNNIANGKEAIEWVVLEKNEDTVTLLSKYGLDAGPYHETYAGITWELCTLRAWLNLVFLNTAFTSIEQAQIKDVVVKAEDSAWYGTKAGNDTIDKVYLLSVSEAVNLVNRVPKVARIIGSCGATQTAIANGAEKEDSPWWLRTPGADQSIAAYFSGEGGSTYLNGTSVDYPEYLVRPSICLKI